MSSTAQAALPDHLRLPPIPGALHAEVRGPVVRAHGAAERALRQVARRTDVADFVKQDVGGAVRGLLTGVFAVAEAASEGRRRLAGKPLDRIAREKADLELRLVGASAGEISPLKKAIAAADMQSREVGRLAREVPTLEARLAQVCGEIEALAARAEADLGAEGLLHEMRAWQTTADQALAAFERTVADRA